MKKLLDIHKNIISKQNAKNKFQFTIDEKSNRVIGYQITQPKFFQGGKKNPEQLKCGSKINFRKLFKSKGLKNWVIVYDQNNKQYLEDLEYAINKAKAKNLIEIEKPTFVRLPPQKYYSDRKSAAKFIKTFHLEEIAGKKSPRMILFFVSKFTSLKLYDAAKKYYTKKGIPT